MADQLITGTTLIEDKRSEKGQIWSCSGNNFSAVSPDVNDVIISNNGFAQAEADGIGFNVPIYLPHGSEITGVIVFGSISDETWTFNRINLSDASVVTLASGNFNSQDTSIASPYEVVDNSNYAYYIYTSTLDTGDQIYGARIKYD